MMEKKYISAKELAEFLGVSPGTIYNWSGEGMLEKYRMKFGGALRFDIEAIKKDIRRGRFRLLTDSQKADAIANKVICKN